MHPLTQLLILYINNYSGNYTNRQIARYIFENLEEVAKMSAHELSEACFVSQATISRFCKALGYDGYKQFNQACCDYLELYQWSAYDPAEPYEWEEEAKHIAKDINDTVKMIDHETINTLIYDIQKASEVYIIGLSQASMIAHEFQLRLFEMRKPTYIVNDLNHLNTLFDIDSHALIITISQNGKIFSTSRKLLSILNRLPHKKYLITHSIEGETLDAFDSVIRVIQGSSGLSYYSIQFLLDNVLRLYAKEYYHNKSLKTNK